MYLPTTYSPARRASTAHAARVPVRSATVHLGIRASLFSLELAERTGLEPATPGVTGRYSNQLNYRSVDKQKAGGC